MRVIGEDIAADSCPETGLQRPQVLPYERRTGLDGELFLFERVLVEGEHPQRPVVDATAAEVVVDPDGDGVLRAVRDQVRAKGASAVKRPPLELVIRAT